jgi:hypothetical protein
VTFGFSPRDSVKVHEIENDQCVLIVCQDAMSRYVAVSAANQSFKSVQYRFEAAKACVRGTRPHAQEGEQHGSATFSE